MLRHSSPRQVRKHRREQNLQRRIQEWQALIADFGEAGRVLAKDCGVHVSENGFVDGEHLPGIPADASKMLQFINLSLQAKASGKSMTGRTPSAPELQELPR